MLYVASYIPQLKKVQLIKDISPTMSIWSLYYTFGLIVAPRVFTVLQVKHVFESEVVGPRKALYPLSFFSRICNTNSSVLESSSLYL